MIVGYCTVKCGACIFNRNARCTRYLNPGRTHKVGYHGTCSSKREPAVKNSKKTVFINPIKQSKRQ